MCRNGPPSLPFGMPGLEADRVEAGLGPAPRRTAPCPVSACLSSICSARYRCRRTSRGRPRRHARALLRSRPRRGCRAARSRNPEVDLAAWGRATARPPPRARPSACKRCGSRRFDCRSRDLERQAAVCLPDGHGRLRRRPVEEAAEGAVRGARRERGGRTREDPAACERGIGFGGEPVRRLDERLDDVVLRLEIGEDPGGIREVGRDCVGGCERVVEIALRAGDPPELEPVPDHVAVDRGVEPVGHLCASLAGVEEIDGVERHCRVEEVPPHGRVASGRGRKVGMLAGCLVEEDRGLDQIHVALQSLQVVLPAGRLLIVDVGAGTERERIRPLIELECGLGLRQGLWVVGHAVDTRVRDRVPGRHVAP